MHFALRRPTADAALRLTLARFADACLDAADAEHSAPWREWAHDERYDLPGRKLPIVFAAVRPVSELKTISGRARPRVPASGIGPKYLES